MEPILTRDDNVPTVPEEPLQQKASLVSGLGSGSLSREALVFRDLGLKA